MAKGARQPNPKWEAVCDFFPGLFRNEAFFAVGHGIQTAFFALRNACDFFYRHKRTARWGFLALTAALMWGLYCGPELTVHQLAARHPGEIAAVRGTATVFSDVAHNLNGPWDERSVVLSAEDAAYPVVMDAAEELVFRRFIGEPLARLTPDRDGVGAAELTDGQHTVRLEFLDRDGHAYFTLLCYPDACYYAKDGLGSTEKFLPVALQNEDGVATLSMVLFLLAK